MGTWWDLLTKRNIQKYHIIRGHGFDTHQTDTLGKRQVGEALWFWIFSSLALPQYLPSPTDMFTVSSASATRCCRLSPESNQGHLFSTHFQYSENATVTCFWWYIIGGICVSSTHGKAAAYVIRLYTYIHIYYTICNGHMQYVYIYIYNCVCVTYRALQK